MIPPVHNVDHIPGKNAYHTIFGIWIRKDLEYYDAILAQERFEWWYLRKWGALFLAPFLIAAPFFDPIGAALCLLLGFAAFLLGPRWPANLRRMELIGHTIEWIVATDMGAPKMEYLKQEATVLTRYKQFKGWTVDEILDAMVEVEPIARKYI